MWALLVLPTGGDDFDQDPDLARESYLTRSVLAQAVLGDVGGSTKFGVGRTPTT